MTHIRRAGNPVIAKNIAHGGETPSNRIAGICGAGDTITAVGIIGCELAIQLRVTRIVRAGHTIVAIPIYCGERTSTGSRYRIGWVAKVRRAENSIIARVVVDIILTSLTGETEVFGTGIPIIAIGVYRGERHSL